MLYISSFLRFSSFLRRHQKSTTIFYQISDNLVFLLVHSVYICTIIMIHAQTHQKESRKKTFRRWSTNYCNQISIQTLHTHTSSAWNYAKLYFTNLRNYKVAQSNYKVAQNRWGDIKNPDCSNSAFTCSSCTSSVIRCYRSFTW